MDLDSSKRAGIVGIDPGKDRNGRVGMGMHFPERECGGNYARPSWEWFDS